MRTIAVFNIKGGVGKTASAVNLAYVSASHGEDTLLWDVDPQGAASFYLRVKPRISGSVKALVKRKTSSDEVIRQTQIEHLDLLPADISYRKLDTLLQRTTNPRKLIRRFLGSLEPGYDQLIIDCPPGLTVLTDALMNAADVVVVPTIPTTLSLRTLEQLFKHAKKKLPDAKLMPFFTMVDRRRSLHKQIADMAEQRRDRFLRTTIPYSTTVEQMGPRRAPIGEFAASSDAALAYETLWQEIERRERVLDDPAAYHHDDPQRLN